MRKTIDESKLRAELKREVFREIADALDGAEDLNDVSTALVAPDMALPTVDEIRSWSPEKINERWQDVAIVMEQSGGRPEFDTETLTSPPLTKPGSTGQQMLDHNVGREFGPMSMDLLRTMSPDEHIRRRDEVDAFLSRQGKAA